jgi:hypothetical protein
MVRLTRTLENNSSPQKTIHKIKLLYLKNYVLGTDPPSMRTWRTPRNPCSILTVTRWGHLGVPLHRPCEKRHRSDVRKQSELTHIRRAEFVQKGPRFLRSLSLNT